MVREKAFIYPEPLFSIGLEKNFDIDETLKWMSTNWHIPYLTISLFYLPMIYFGPIIMKNRSPFRLKIPLMLWNAGLGLFSILGFIHVLPETIYALKTFGLLHTICSHSYKYHKAACYWHYLFTLSKIPELIDTLFLVLRKNKLIFLHTYHHAVVVIFGWHHFEYLMSTSRWYNTMNYGVHSIMYTYYFLKTMPHIFKIPKWVSIFITSLQIVQMIFGSGFVLSAAYNKLMRVQCDCPWSMIIVGSIIYPSFLILFAKFFYDAYLVSRLGKESIAIAEKKRD